MLQFCKGQDTKSSIRTYIMFWVSQIKAVALKYQVSGEREDKAVSSWEGLAGRV
jgi:hypothetical protein